MDLANRKLQIMEQLMGIINPESIDKIENFLKKEIKNTDVWDEIPEVVQKVIDNSIEESNKGQVIPHSEVMTKYKVKEKLKEIDLIFFWNNKKDLKELEKYLK